jgi:hypothetical protein
VNGSATTNSSLRYGRLRNNPATHLAFTAENFSTPRVRRSIGALEPSWQTSDSFRRSQTSFVLPRDRLAARRARAPLGPALARKGASNKTELRRSADATVSEIVLPRVRALHRTRGMSRSTSPPRSELKSIRSSQRSGARLASTAWTLICQSAPLCPAQSALSRFQTRS